MLGISLGLTARLNSSAFNPAVLFGLTDTGWVYEHSDFSTLFQDAAGTIPVTDVGQPVGLQLDKSKGLVLGSELVTNRTFDSGSAAGWINLGSDAALPNSYVVDGAMRVGSATNQTVATAIPAVSTTTTIRISFMARRVGGTAVDMQVWLSQQYGENIVTIRSYGNISTAWTSYTLIFLNSGFSRNRFSIREQAGTSGIVEIDDISIRELRGNHRTQSISLNRPTLARHPLGGIRNRLTFTEQFDNAAWTKFNATTTLNATTAPDGTTTAEALLETATTAGHSAHQSINTVDGATYSASVYIKPNGRNFAFLRTSNTAGDANLHGVSVDLMAATAALAVGSPANISCVAAANGFVRVSFSFSAVTTARIEVITSTDGVYANRSYAGDITKGLFVWGAQLELGSTATDYQRVVTPFDVTEAGVPDLHYLSYDGINDSMATASFAWGTDKATVVAGVRKLSDAAGARTIVETSTNSDSTNGTFRLGTDAATFTWRSRGTVSANPSGAGAQPITAVLTGIGDIAGDVARLRRNAAQVGEVLTDQGTGNFLTYPAYFGARAGTSLFFNGREYSQFAINRLLTTDELAQIEAYTAGKTGVVL